MAGLGDYTVAGVLRAENYDRAKKFYTEVLGLRSEQVGAASREGKFWAADGTMAFIYERPGMPAPQNTALAFGVPKASFEAVLADLRGKGVRFEEYNIPEIGLKTVNGVAEYDGIKSAWFKDTEGNILNVVEM